MKKKILVINGNPIKGSLSERIAEAYIHGAKKKNNNVKFINLRTLKFDPILWEGYSRKSKLEKSIRKSQNLILWADHIVFVFPVWWGSMPALLKGWLDKILLPGFAFKYHKGKRLQDRYLKGKTVHLIRTSGAPKEFYWIPGVSDNLNWRLNICAFTGMKLKKITTFGSMRRGTTKSRIEEILKKVEKIGESKP